MCLQHWLHTTGEWETWSGDPKSFPEKHRYISIGSSSSWRRGKPKKTLSEISLALEGRGLG
jgi:hypothetical protein